ncbi:hypothetical protein HanIR_Chr09g0416451 [Helianthus annuus]|nr:hypothetical protein HanIR_Chr09g0416451 [Helianthus annuus]
MFTCNPLEAPSLNNFEPMFSVLILVLVLVLVLPFVFEFLFGRWWWWLDSDVGIRWHVGSFFGWDGVRMWAVKIH